MLGKKEKEFNIIKIYKSWYVLLLFSLILLLLTYIITSSEFMKEVEYKLIDLRFKLAPIPERADSNIVIVTIDDASLNFFKENGISYPWPRSYYAHVVDYFNKAGAEAVIFDMQFYEPDMDWEETYAEETDGMFAESIAKAANVYLSAQLSADERLDRADLSRFSFQNEIIRNLSKNFKGVLAPIESFLKTTKSVGIINIEPDKDGVIRRIPVWYSYKNEILMQLSFAVWTDRFFPQQNFRIIKNKIKAGDFSIPLDKDKNYFVNWYGSSQEKSVFEYYPFQAVISSAAAVSRNMEPIIPLEKFKDKYIIIGATAAGLLDLKTTPLTKILPGMEIWATVLSNLVNKDFVHFAAFWIEFILNFLIIFIILFAVSHFTDKRSHLLIFLLLIIMILTNYFLWKQARIVLNFVFLFTGFLLAYLTIIVISYLIEGKSKREIRRIFSRYLHPDVIEKLVEHPTQIEMGGEEIQATVLFTDIANFTAFSETKTPKELITDLNIYLNKITGLVLENHGLLDKYTGDGIMALFGVPIAREDHAKLACKMAIEHRKLCESFDKDSLSIPENFHLHTRIGIHSGSLVAGNIGSDKRMDYTAIGDTVNLSSRLEGVNKIFGTWVIISEATYQLVKEEFRCRELDFLRVKGKKEPTRIYELISMIDEKKTVRIKDYERALKIYRKGDFKQAEQIFRKLIKDFNDSPAKEMLDRCKSLIKTPPEKWDGIYTMEVK